MAFFNGIDLSSLFHDYKDMLFKSKKYWLIYLVLILALGITTMSRKNFLHPHFEIFTFILVAVLGIFCIVFYFLHDNDEDLYKVAFVVIVCFGIVCALIVPICDVSDETEHLTRAEITSRGVLVPHWTGEDLGVEGYFNHTEGQVYSTACNKGAGFYTIQSMIFFTQFLGKTVFETNHDTDKINHSFYLTSSAFEQNPFYGYLPQAIGILIAKLLDLNVIWMLWLARFFNLLFYAGIVSLAIKKTPVLKIPLFAVACIPISIYQAASASIDSMIISLSILAISYFIYMCQAGEKSITRKEIIVFGIICTALGLCKLTYLPFIFLLLLVPFKNYEDSKRNLILIFAVIAVVGIIGFMWSKHSTPTLLHSWRGSRNLVNSTLQMEYLRNHPDHILKFFKTIFTRDLRHLLNGVFSFFEARQVLDHYVDHYIVVTLSILSFLVVTLLSYPQKVKFALKARIGSFLMILLIYVLTCYVQLLTWAFVGHFNLGLSLRYFVQLFALIPIAFLFYYNPIKKETFDKYAIVLIIAFLATMIISFATKYYWLI